MGGGVSSTTTSMVLREDRCNNFTHCAGASARVVMPKYYVEDPVTTIDYMTISKTGWLLTFPCKNDTRSQNNEIISSEEKLDIKLFAQELSKAAMKFHSTCGGMIAFNKTASVNNILFLLIHGNSQCDEMCLILKVSFIVSGLFGAGVRTPAYGYFGEALFTTLRESLGTEVYTDEVHRAWVRRYSQMLRWFICGTIALERGIPIASALDSVIHNELKQGNKNIRIVNTPLNHVCAFLVDEDEESTARSIASD